MTANRQVIPAEERFGRPRRRRRLWLALGAALLATATAGGYLLLTSSAFALRQVVVRLTVDSSSKLNRQVVIRAAQAPLARPLVDLPVGRIRDRVAAVPGVAAVSVHRTWPHTLEIDVTGRHAAAVLRSGGGAFFVDASGVVYAPAGPTVGPQRWPQVLVPGAALHVSNRSQPPAAAAVRAVLSVPARLRRQVRDLRFQAGRLSFRWRSFAVVWGTGAGGAVKADELATVAARRPKARRPRWVDVSTPGVLVTRPRRAGTG